MGSGQISFFIYLSSFIIALLALGFIIFLLVYQKKLLAEENKAKAMETEMQQKMLEATIQGQEREKDRLASDLHDSLGASLSMAKMMLEKSISQRGEPDPLQQKATQVLNASLADLRQISHGLSPRLLQRFGLKETLKDHLDNIARSTETTTQLNWQVPASRFTADQQLSLFRVIQEMIQNLLKHNRVGCITLEGSIRENQVVIQLTDDGTSFNWVQPGTGSGIGIMNIKTRLSLLNASLEHAVPEAGGNRVTLTIRN